GGVRRRGVQRGAHGTAHRRPHPGAPRSFGAGHGGSAAPSVPAAPGAGYGGGFSGGQGGGGPGRRLERRGAHGAGLYPPRRRRGSGGPLHSRRVHELEGVVPAGGFGTGSVGSAGDAPRGVRGG